MTDRVETLIGLRILVVEDEGALALLLEDMLQDLGCVVDSAPTVEAALASIRVQAPDGVLLDVNLHGQASIAVADELVARSVPFLLVTGYHSAAGDPSVIKSAPRLQKPFNEVDLARKMVEVFAPA